MVNGQLRRRLRSNIENSWSIFGRLAPTAEPAQEDAATAEENIPVVGFMKIVSHPALEDEQQGVKDALAAAEYLEAT